MPTEPSRPTELVTDRLQLRRWRRSDREPFAALNADPEVMEYFPALLSRAESGALVDRIEEGFQRHGFGLWAVEREGVLLGFTGLSVPRFTAAFLPAVEVGWRLRRDAWGQGFATEAARAAVEAGFQRWGLDEIVSFTSEANARSRAVMARIGMTRDPDDDFDHPALPRGHRRERHVLYRLRCPR